MRRGPYKPKDYAVRFNTDLLVGKVMAKMDAEGLTWLGVAKVTGVTAATLSHLALGRIDAPGGHILCTLMDWIGETDLAPYMIQTGRNER